MKPLAAKRPTVLVIDDDASLVQAVKALLEQRHYHVLTAHDGVQALTIIAAQTPQLILLDIDMPKLDGEGLALQLHHHPTWRAIPIIALTGISDMRDQHLMATLGVTEYLCKPCPTEELLAAIYRVLPTAVVP